MLLKGKNALVTGGSRGIGYAIAKKYAENGANVAFTYLNSIEKANAMVNEISSAYGVRVLAFQSDASSYQAAEELVAAVVNELGQIDILVNNAGITKDNLILRMSEEQFDEVIKSNLKSVFNLTKHVSKHMLRQKSGSIINLSSIVGLRGQGGTEQLCRIQGRHHRFQ